MSGAVMAGGVAALGVGLALAGQRLIKSNEVKKGETAFASAVSSRTLGYSGGYILLFLGLLLAAMIAPMVYLSH